MLEDALDGTKGIQIGTVFLGIRHGDETDEGHVLDHEDGGGDHHHILWKLKYSMAEESNTSRIVAWHRGGQVEKVGKRCHFLVETRRTRAGDLARCCSAQLLLLSSLYKENDVMSKVVTSFGLRPKLNEEGP